MRKQFDRINKLGDLGSNIGLLIYSHCLLKFNDYLPMLGINYDRRQNAKNKTGVGAALIEPVNHEGGKKSNNHNTQ